jgi:hypothetical protein
MSDWQVGDLALCVSRHDAYPAIVQPGRSFVVLGVWRDIPAVGDPSDLGIALTFRGVPRMDDGESGYDAARFRKILPDKHEACEPKFVTLLKRTKRTVTA